MPKLGRAYLCGLQPTDTAVSDVCGVRAEARYGQDAVQPGHHEGQPGWESARSVTVCWVAGLPLTRRRYVQAEALTTFLDEVANAPVGDAVLPGKAAHR